MSLITQGFGTSFAVQRLGVEEKLSFNIVDDRITADVTEKTIGAALYADQTSGDVIEEKITSKVYEEE